MLFDCRPKVLHKHCLQFLLGVKMAPRETENNAYAKFWGDKQRTLWYVMVFLEWSMSVLQKLILNLTNPAVRHKKIIFLNLIAISPCFLSWWVAKLIKMIYYNNGIWNNMKNFNYFIENNQAKHWCVFCKINYTLKLCFLKSTESH